MTLARLLTLALAALPLAIATTGSDAAAQSRFTPPAAQAGEMRFRAMDRNRDGVITRDEWRGSDQSFRAHDWNNDGVLSGDEVRPGVLRPDLATEPARDAGIWDDREDTFENLDVNRNDRIEPREWHGSADAFRWLDRDNDGTLSRGEVVGSDARRRARDRGEAGQAPRRAPAPDTPQDPDCTSSAAKVVDDIYQQVLERSAGEGSAGMTQALASGRMTVREVVAAVAKSPEHAERFFWRPLVARLYQGTLNRDPSDDELRAAASELASGQRRLPEIIARMVRRASSSDEEAVRRLYQRLLGREADPDGLRAFTEMASRHGIEAVAREMVASAEYRRRAQTTDGPAGASSYEAAVRSLYQHVLGREPDEEGARDLTQLAMVYNFDAVVDRMVRSPEYERLYGNDRVPGRDVRYCAPAR